LKVIQLLPAARIVCFCTRGGKEYRFLGHINKTCGLSRPYGLEAMSFLPNDEQLSPLPDQLTR
jgi:hypothetical protein